MMKHGWGTGRLCARTINGEIWSYRTKLAARGPTASRDDHDSVFVRVQELDGGLAYKFAEGSISSRLLIRSRSHADIRTVSEDAQDAAFWAMQEHPEAAG